MQVARLHNGAVPSVAGRMAADGRRTLRSESVEMSKGMWVAIASLEDACRGKFPEVMGPKAVIFMRNNPVGRTRIGTDAELNFAVCRSWRTSNQKQIARGMRCVS